MTMKFSEREKKLLILLAIAGFIALSYVLGYTPLMEMQKTAKTNHELVKKQYRNAQVQIESTESLKAQTAALEEKAKSKTNRFFTVNQEETVDTMNNVINGSGIGFGSASMSLSGAKAIAAAATAAGGAAKTVYTLGDAARAINVALGKTAASKPVATVPAKMEVCEAMRLNISYRNASMDQVLNFLRMMEEMNRIYKVNSFSISNQAQGSTGNIDMELFTIPVI